MISYDEWGYPYEEPSVPTFLVGCRNFEFAQKIAPALATASTTIWPKFHVAAVEFDKGLMFFEPTTPEEQRWFHNVFKPKIKDGGEIIFAEI